MWSSWLAFLLIFYNFIMTVAQRQEPILYVSVWYVLAAVILTACTYALGNVIWRPNTGALVGIPDAILLWFYGHNIFGLLLTPLSIGVAYYVIPRATGNPLYSHTLSLLGFWSLIVIYTHIGTHHLLQVPVPTWLKVVAIVDSVAMVIPVIGLPDQHLVHGQGQAGRDPCRHRRQVRLHRHHHVLFRQHPGLVDVPARCAARHPLQQLGGGPRPYRGAGLCRHDRPGRVLLHLPKMTGRPLYSRFLADFQYWMILIGMVGFTVVLTIAGLIQGNAWLNGETVYRVLPQFHVYFVVRAGLGVLIWGSALLGLYNIVRSLLPKSGAVS
jgi:cytochrome c oxidase cbb3-type subunit I